MSLTRRSLLTGAALTPLASALPKPPLVPWVTVTAHGFTATVPAGLEAHARALCHWLKTFNGRYGVEPGVWMFYPGDRDRRAVAASFRLAR